MVVCVERTPLGNTVNLTARQKGRVIKALVYANAIEADEYLQSLMNARKKGRV